MNQSGPNGQKRIEMNKEKWTEIDRIDQSGTNWTAVDRGELSGP